MKSCATFVVAGSAGKDPSREGLNSPETYPSRAKWYPLGPTHITVNPDAVNPKGSQYSLLKLKARLKRNSVSTDLLLSDVGTTNQNSPFFLIFDKPAE
jgi:hypothetical protein